MKLVTGKDFFDTYYGEDDWKQSSVQVLKDGIGKIYLNLGFKMHLIRNDGSEEDLSILIKLQTRISVTDHKRLTYSVHKPRPEI